MLLVYLVYHIFFKLVPNSILSTQISVHFTILTAVADDLRESERKLREY